MANSKISDLGYKIEMGDQGEDLHPVLGNGSNKAGQVGSIDPATGKFVATLGGTNDNFLGFLQKHPNLAIDTALTDALPGNMIKPKSGHIYRLFCKDPGGDKAQGALFRLPIATETAGSLTSMGAIVATSPPVARAHKAIANGDTVGEFEWL